MCIINNYLYALCSSGMDNDLEGRITICPAGNSIETPCTSAEQAASYVSAALERPPF